MSFLHAVSSFLAVRRVSSSPRGLRPQILLAIKSLPNDKTRWTRVCVRRAKALSDVLSMARRREPEDHLFWESLLEIVRVLIAKHRESILQLEDREANAFMCLLQALLDFIPRGSVYRHSLMYVMMALALRSQQVPESLMIRGLTARTEEVNVSGFGDARRAKWRGKTVALKTPRHSVHLEDYKDVYGRLCREVLLWRQLRHPHVLEYFGVLPDNADADLPTIVTPWMEHSTVLQYVENQPDISKLTLLRQVARALNYLHRHDPPIVHQDLRCANIFVNNACDAVLGDFGLSRLSEAAFQSTMISLRDGCTRWQAPELLFPPASPSPASSSAPSPRASRKTDIWSFGMMVLELFTESAPFDHVAHDAAVAVDLYHDALPRRPTWYELRGAEAEVRDFDAVWEIVERCWAKEPRERPSASALVRQIDLGAFARRRGKDSDSSPRTTVTDSGYRERASTHLYRDYSEPSSASPLDALRSMNSKESLYYRPSINFNRLCAPPKPTETIGLEISYGKPGLNIRHNQRGGSSPPLSPHQDVGNNDFESIPDLEVNSDEIFADTERTRPSFAVYHDEEVSYDWSRERHGARCLIVSASSSSSASEIETVPRTPPEAVSNGPNVWPAVTRSSSPRQTRTSVLDAWSTGEDSHGSSTPSSRSPTPVYISEPCDFSPVPSEHDGIAHEESYELPESPPCALIDFSHEPVNYDSRRSSKSLPSLARSRSLIIRKSKSRSLSSLGSSHESHHYSTNLPARTQMLSRPSVARLPFRTISRSCFETMFSSDPGSLAALESMHGVEILFKVVASGMKFELYIVASGEMPDALSAQWEIEKIIEFYDRFGVPTVPLSFS